MSINFLFLFPRIKKNAKKQKETRTTHELLSIASFFFTHFEIAQQSSAHQVLFPRWTLIAHIRRRPLAIVSQMLDPFCLQAPQK